MCRVWWKRGQRPPGLCDKRFTFAYIFAVVEPGTDNAFALVLPYANTEAMQEFLDQFAATIGEDEHIVLILDQAGWHGADALRVPANITLVPLPPYSPELNPVEWLWEYMKERFLSLRLHNDYDAIADAACKAWNRLLAENRSHHLAVLTPLDHGGQTLGALVVGCGHKDLQTEVVARSAVQRGRSPEREQRFASAAPASNVSAVEEPSTDPGLKPAVFRGKALRLETMPSSPTGGVCVNRYRNRPPHCPKKFPRAHFLENATRHHATIGASPTATGAAEPFTQRAKIT